MSLPVVSAFYASLLATLLLALAVKVIVMRRRSGTNLGHGGDKLLERRIRAHANCAEYVPTGLLLLLVVELLGYPAEVLHALGMTLLAGRLLHALALSGSESSPFGRVAGMALTFAAIGTAAALCLWGSLSAQLPA